ncbi:MmyB family transcriptional regulator [Streptomyces sp. NPDC004262]
MHIFPWLAVRRRHTMEPRLADDDAAVTGRAARTAPKGQQVSSATRVLLDGPVNVPALLLGRRMDVLAWNRLGAALRFSHRVAGELELDFQVLDVRGGTDQSLLVYTAEPGSHSAEALAFLTSWSAARAPGSRPELGSDREHRA